MFSIAPVFNVSKVNYFKSVSFKGMNSSQDVFEKSSDTMKKSWKYLTPVKNPIIRQSFEKHFLQDSHYVHDGKNGDWIIRDEKKGNNTIYYASEQHPARIMEIRAFGKKGNIFKNAGSVAKIAGLDFDKDSNTYVAKPVNVKTKDGIKSAVMRYIWVEEESKMFLKSIKLEKVA